MLVAVLAIVVGGLVVFGEPAPGGSADIGAGAVQQGDAATVEGPAARVRGRVLLEVQPEPPSEPQDPVEAPAEAAGQPSDVQNGRVDPGGTAMPAGASTAADRAPPPAEVPLEPPAPGTCTARAWQQGQRVGGPVTCRRGGRFELELEAGVSGEVAIEMLVPGRLRGVVTAVARSGGVAELPTVALGVGQTVTGQVVDGRGRPAQGVAVEARPDPDLDEPEPWRARTDVDGRFEFTTLPPGPVVIRGRKQGHEPSVVQAIAPAEDLLITLGGLVDLRGEVIAGPNLVTDAIVRLEGSAVWPAIEVEPEPDGGFRFPQIPDGIYGLEAIVRRPSGGQEFASFPLENVEPDMYVSLTLIEATRVPVRVVGAAGDPVPEARVTMSYSTVGLLQRVATTDDRGRARVGPVVPGPYVLFADADGYLQSEPIALDVSADGSVEEQTLVLDRPGRIEGTVVDGRGRPVADATVLVESDGVHGLGASQSRADVFAATLQSAGSLGVTTGPIPDIPLFGGPAPPLGGNVQSGPEGGFVLDDLVPGTYRLRAVHGRYAGSGEVSVRVRSDGVHDGIELVLRTGEALTGRILDGNGQPIAQARVELADGSVAYTDERGVFDAGFRRGRQRMVLRAAGMEPEAVTVSMGDEAVDVEYTLRPARGRIAGRVRDANERPIEDVRVTLGMTDGLSPTSVTWTDAYGTFEFRDVSTGQARLRLDHPEYAVEELPVRISAGDPDELQLTLVEGWTLEIVVLEEGTREPIEGAEVTVAGRTALTDEAGGARFARLPGTRATAEVEAEGWTPARRAVTRPQRELVVQLGRGGAIEGNVTDYRGDPVPRATIVIRSAGGKVLAKLRADQDGRWRADGLPEGDVVVSAEPPPSRAAELTPTHQKSDVLQGHVTKAVQVRFDRR